MARSLHQLLTNLDDFARRAHFRRSNLIDCKTASSQKHAPRGVKFFFALLLTTLVVACTPQVDAEPQRASTLAGSLQPYQTPSPSAVPLTATPIPTRTPLPTPTPHIYIVESGDTMGSIALEFGFDIGDLVNANPDVSPYAMSIGQELVIPPDEPETVVTAVEPLEIPFADPNCYATLSGGLWCFVLAQNNTQRFVEGISFDVQVYDGTGTLVASQTAFPLLDRLSVDKTMSALVYFDSVPAERQVYAELLTAFEGTADDENYLSANLTSVLTQIAWDGKSAQVSGEVLVDGDAERVWVVVTAFDAADQVVGVRRWESDAGEQSFDLTVASLGPEIVRVSLSAEAKR